MHIVQDGEKGKQKNSFLGRRCGRTEGGSTKEAGEEAREVVKDGRGKREGQREGACFTAVFHLLASLCLSPSPHLPLFLTSHKTAESARAWGLYQTVSHTVYLCIAGSSKDTNVYNTVFRHGCVCVWLGQQHLLECVT